MSRFKSAGRSIFKATVSAYFLMALYAMLLNMVGEILPPIIEEFNLTMARAGMLQMLFNIGGIITLLIMLYFSDRIRKSRLIYYSFLLTSIAMAISGIFTQSYIFLLIAFVILGSTTKVFDVSVNAYINDINTKGREFFLQMLHMSFGIGAAVGPAYASFMILSNFGWRSTLWVLAAIYALFLVISFFTVYKPKDEIEKHPHHNKEKLKILSLLKSPSVWVLVIGASCFSGAYAGLITWFPSYTRSLEGDIGKLSGLILSIYFIGYIISRGLASIILTEKNTKFLIILTSFLGGVFFLIAFAIAEPWAFFVFLVTAGFFSGASLPMIISAACITYPNNTGGVTTILYIGISLLAMVTPYLMGYIGDTSGLQKAMPIVGYLMLFASGASLFIRRRSS